MIFRYCRYFCCYCLLVWLRVRDVWFSFRWKRTRSGKASFYMAVACSCMASLLLLTVPIVRHRFSDFMVPFLSLQLACVVVCVWCLRKSFVKRHRRRRRKRSTAAPVSVSVPNGFPEKKPAWVKQCVLTLQERFGLSHRKLADLFNQLYFASTGISVGRTWVRDLLLQEAHEALHRQTECKHRVPEPIPKNRVWGIDTTCVTDANKIQHIVLGMIDHGARLNLMLQYLKRLNAYTFLGCVFLAMGQFGKPAAIKTDNHPVFHTKWVKRVLRWCGVRMTFSRPAKPWENGYIERLFGTFKSCLRSYVIRDAQHLVRSLPSFQFWYNIVRSHQHLGGCTPALSR